MTCVLICVAIAAGKIISSVLIVERLDIDHEPISNVAVYDPLVSLIHFLNRGKLDIAGDIVFAAEIKHLLGSSDSANRRTCKTVSSTY